MKTFIIYTYVDSSVSKSINIGSGMKTFIIYTYVESSVSKSINIGLGIKLMFRELNGT